MSGVEMLAVTAPDGWGAWTAALAGPLVSAGAAVVALVIASRTRGREDSLRTIAAMQRARMVVIELFVMPTGSMPINTNVACRVQNDGEFGILDVQVTVIDKHPDMSTDGPLHFDWPLIRAHDAARESRSTFALRPRSQEELDKAGDGALVALPVEFTWRVNWSDADGTRWLRAEGAEPERVKKVA